MLLEVGTNGSGLGASLVHWHCWQLPHFFACWQVGNLRQEVQEFSMSHLVAENCSNKPKGPRPTFLDFPYTLELYDMLSALVWARNGLVASECWQLAHCSGWFEMQKMPWFLCTLSHWSFIHMQLSIGTNSHFFAFFVVPTCSGAFWIYFDYIGIFEKKCSSSRMLVLMLVLMFIVLWGQFFYTSILKELCHCISTVFSFVVSSVWLLIFNWSCMRVFCTYMTDKLNCFLTCQF